MSIPDLDLTARLVGLPLPVLWTRYLGVGGSMSLAALVARVAGERAWPPREEHFLAVALNDALIDESLVGLDPFAGLQLTADWPSARPGRSADLETLRLQSWNSRALAGLLRETAQQARRRAASPAVHPPNRPRPASAAGPVAGDGRASARQPGTARCADHVAGRCARPDAGFAELVGLHRPVHGRRGGPRVAGLRPPARPQARGGELAALSHPRPAGPHALPPVERRGPQLAAHEGAGGPGARSPRTDVGVGGHERADRRRTRSLPGELCRVRNGCGTELASACVRQPACPPRTPMTVGQRETEDLSSVAPDRGGRPCRADGSPKTAAAGCAAPAKRSISSARSPSASTR